MLRNQCLAAQLADIELFLENTIFCKQGRNLSATCMSTLESEILGVTWGSVTFCV